MFRRAAAGLATAVLATTMLAACSSPSAPPAAEDCEPAHEFETLRDGYLAVSTYALPPYAIVRDRELTADGVALEHGGTLEGVDGDILAEFAERECLELDVYSTAAAAVLSTVEAGGVDVGAGNWYRTAQRAEVLDLTGPVYADEVGIVSADGVSDITELQGRRVGTVLGYLYVPELRDYLGDSLVLYNSPLTMFRELEQGKIDAAVDSVGVGSEFIRDSDLKVEVIDPFEELSFSLEPAQSAFLVQKGRDDLLAALNETIAELRESGRLAEILKKNGLDPSAAEPGEPRLLGG